MRREYRGAAAPSYLSLPLGNSTGDLTINCNDLSNWPDGTGGRPFYVVIDRGTASEEKILCSSRSGNTLTVFNNGIIVGRGADDTSIVAHSTNAEIEHIFTATDADEANEHVNAPALHITATTSTNRPSPATTNQVILETDTGNMLAYIGGQWVEVTAAGATGGGTDRVFWENDKTIGTNYTITSTKNAGSFGPITINSGVTVTVPSGCVWTVM